MRLRYAFAASLTILIAGAVAGWALSRRLPASVSVRAVAETPRYRAPVVLERPRVIDRGVRTVLVEVPALPVLQPREEGGETWTDLEETFGVEFGTVPGTESRTESGLAPGVYPLEVGDAAPSLYGWRHVAALRVGADGSTDVQIIAAERTADGHRFGMWGLTEFYARGGAILTSEGYTGTVSAGLVQDVLRWRRTQGQLYAEAGYDFATYGLALDGWRLEAGLQLARRWGRPR